MSEIPCSENKELKKKIEAFSETLKTEAHTLPGHDLSEDEFYNSGLFRGAIERIRGQFSASMSEKREFARHILNHMQDHGYIQNWDSTGETNRHDYTVTLNNGKTAAIELKGCLDGNNTTIFERPKQAQEFVLWSICTNPGANPRKNIWSGLHTRLSADIITRGQPVDGVIMWDMACGTLGRPCPKVTSDDRLNTVGPFRLPPPCLYLMPATIPSPRNNPSPQPHSISDVGLMQAFYDCFGVQEDEVNQVLIQVEHQGAETVRTTTILRGGTIQKQSAPTTLKRG